MSSMFVARHIDAVVAMSDLDVERVHHRRLCEAFLSDPDIGAYCLSQLMEDGRRLHSWVTGLGQASAEERLAALLLDLRRRLISSKTIPEDAACYSMPLTQKQLAEHIGSTPVDVNRVLRSFRERDLVTVRDGLVDIKDLMALMQHASALLNF